jgi:hypothetical protein
VIIGDCLNAITAKEKLKKCLGMVLEINPAVVRDISCQEIQIPLMDILGRLEGTHYIQLSMQLFSDARILMLLVMNAMGLEALLFVMSGF